MGTETRRTLAAFIADERITATARRVEWSERKDGEDWAGARCFSVTLKRGAQRFRVRFHQGSAHTADPTAADVLNCLATEVCCHRNARSFEEWCSEYGSDPDSRTAERIYNTIGAQADALAVFLGSEDTLQTLLYNMEQE